MKHIYLDNNATTRVAPEVYDEMLPYLTESYGNPSSIYSIGAEAGTKIKEARERVSAFLHCRESELVFTSGGTESNNFAIRGALEATPDKRHIVTTRVEHPSILNVVDRMERLGYRVTLLEVDADGRLDLDTLGDALSDDTALLSIMYANNETGVVFPIERIIEIIKPRGIPFHVDAVQAAGKVRIDLSEPGIDLLSLSGHKLHAPKGIGALFIRKGTRIRPLMLGGHQERGMRGGTENVAFIAGLAKACELAEQNLGYMQNAVKRLRDKLEQGILSTVPGAQINGLKAHRLPNTSNISFPQVEGEAVLMLADEIGICASGGSACASGSLEPSHVLRAMGLTEDRLKGAVRFSLSRYTREEEIDSVLKELPPIVKRLREARSSPGMRKDPPSESRPAE